MNKQETLDFWESVNQLTNSIHEQIKKNKCGDHNKGLTHDIKTLLEMVKHPHPQYYAIYIAQAYTKETRTQRFLHLKISIQQQQINDYISLWENA